MPQLRTALGKQYRCEQRGRDADRDVDEEDPRPAEIARQNTPEEDAGRGTAAGRSPVDAERKVALTPFRECRHEQGQRCRRKQRTGEPLQSAEADQRRLRPGDPAEQRAGREEQQPRDEEAAPTEQVGKPASEQQCAAEEDRVGGHHPLQALVRKIEIGLDRRQRDVHDRHVEDHHELRRHDHGQRSPAPSRIRSKAHQLISSTVDDLNNIHKQRYWRYTFFMTEIETKPIPQRFPEELVSSALFLLKRLGMTAKERSFVAYSEAGLHPYHHAILAVLDEGSLATPRRDRRHPRLRQGPARRAA